MRYRKNKLNRTHPALIAAAFALVGAPVADAITINTTFDNVGSLSPAFDPTGTGLTSLFNYVADRFEFIFEDNNHTLNITFRYANLAAGLIGQHTYGTADLNGRENSAVIRIDPSPNWFIDPTPNDDSEYNMGQTLWRDLSGTQKADWYNFGAANVPETFEVGYTGNRVVGGDAPVNSTDMLSVVFHEIGHALGMSAANPLTILETAGDGVNNGDYDFDPDYVAGESFGIEVANTGGCGCDDNANIAHVESPFALMNPGIGQNLRRRPSHSDFFAMASVNFYNIVDVPRREFYQNSNWQNPDNWSGHRLPDASDEIFVRAAQGDGVNLTAQLNANAVGRDLRVSEGANFRTNGFKLDLGDDAFVSDTDSDIFINPGGELEADHIVIQNNAEIEMNGGLIDSRRVTIEPGTQLEGRTNSMTIDVSQRLQVDGTLVANDGATMNFTSVDADAWNLDGAGDNDGNGFVNASNGSMNFLNSDMSDGFGGTMRIGPTRFISFAQSWVLNTGTLDLNGGVDFANRARINGGSISNTGGVVSASGVSHINPTFIMSGGELDVFKATGQTSAELEFNGAVSISGGDIDVFADSVADFDNTANISGGNFDIFARGRMKFDAATTISGGTLDLNGGVDVANRAWIDGGGAINYSNATVEASGIVHINNTLNIFSGNFTTFLNDELEFNGTVAISGGDFTAGNGSVIDFDGPLTLSGSPDFTTFGTEIADGQVRFDGATTYAGGTIDVVGLARQSGAATVTVDTTINADVFDVDGSLAPQWTLNKTLTINADSVETGVSNTINSDFDINNPGILLFGSTSGGNLNVNLPGSTEWTLAGTVALDGSVAGGLVALIPSMISGSPVNLTGAVTMKDRGSIAARADISGTVSTVDGASIVRLTGGDTVDTNRLLGGTIGGPGTLGTVVGRALHGHGTINIATVDFGGSNIMADDGVLTVSSTIADVGVIGTADTDGHLILSLPFNTNIADRLELNGGTVAGANLTNGTVALPGLISGFGVITSNQVINNGTIRAEGGTLVLDYNVNPDLDGGVGEPGVIQAINGNLTVVDPVTDFFGGVATVGVARTMRFQQGWTLNSNGTLNLNGGTSIANAAVVAGLSQTLFGTVNVITGSFEAPTTFTSSARVEIVKPAHRLVLDADATVAAGAAFNGDGTLENAAGSTLSLLDGASVGVNIENDGTLEVGSSPGIASGVQLANLSKAVMVMEVFLPAVPDPKPDPGVDYDQLNISGTVRLSGTLDVDPVVRELPLLGTEYHIMTYGSRVGSFDVIDDTQLKPGVALAPLFSDTDKDDVDDTLILRATVPGDLNLDDKVSVADLSTFALYFNTGPGYYDEALKLNSWELGDFNSDGKITVTDLSLMAVNFGFDLDAATPAFGLSLDEVAVMAGIDLSSVPEPGVVGVVVLGVMLGGWRVRS